APPPARSPPSPTRPSVRTARWPASTWASCSRPRPRLTARPPRRARSTRSRSSPALTADREMPADARKVTPEDLLPHADYAKVRRQRRAALLPIKRLRRIHLGPICTIIFESYETMLFQIQEMLLTEGGGPAQLPDELAAYNPLIPQGEELVATVM